MAAAEEADNGTSSAAAAAAAYLKMSERLSVRLHHVRLKDGNKQSLQTL